jgi:hypothetical protein
LSEDRLERLISRGIDGLVGLLHTGIIGVVVIFIFFYAKEVLVAFAGKETAANLALSLAANLQLDRWLAYLVGASGVGYGIRQRQVRRRNIERMTGHNAEVEKQVHPTRTSSGLTAKGKTRREDR